MEIEKHSPKWLLNEIRNAESEAHALFKIIEFKKALTEQCNIANVGSSLPKVCKGCGTLSTKVIDKKYLSCCPDNNYIDMEDYCKNSIYPEKQF
jgi:hypothetical protein